MKKNHTLPLFFLFTGLYCLIAMEENPKERVFICQTKSLCQQSAAVLARELTQQLINNKKNWDEIETELAFSIEIPQDLKSVIKQEIAREYFFKTGTFIEKKYKTFVDTPYGFSIFELKNSGHVQDHFAILSENLNLSNLHINDLTGLYTIENISSVKTLHLNNNNLDNLPKGIFDGLTQLKNLRLNNNQLSSIPENVFNNLSRLNWLNLNNNQLRSLPTGIFDSLIQLKSLHLSNNKLSSLAKNIFNNLSQLSWLHLSNNPLSHLPTGIFRNNPNITLDEIGVEQTIIDDLNQREKQEKYKKMRG